jgi:hypothetical protein
MKRAELVAAIREKLMGRRVVWAGLRGDDVEPLADLPERSQGGP